ncbi:hypothetical protein BDZ94DRAFT_1253244 [Collybia nuda]|uniref:Uncharacterized protein n=1 Tax=Collybia nuda TaxID=64659 RepID=A0A9P5YBT6_9AGAR|nr:hypothetical protein BDZ94DRAFT_1253244 [Collybia nuda]
MYSERSSLFAMMRHCRVLYPRPRAKCKDIQYYSGTSPHLAAPRQGQVDSPKFHG